MNQVFRNMRERSVCYVYGKLAKDNMTPIDTEELISNKKTIKAFDVRDWIKGQSLFKQMGLLRKVTRMLTSTLKTTISKEFKLEDINSAIVFYENNMTQGKVLIKPFMCSEKIF